MKKFPKKVNGLAGPITIELVDAPFVAKGEDGDELAGRWQAMSRVIQVCTRQSLREQWRTFYHELNHAAFADSGMSELLTTPMEEAICELLATARMVEDGL